jgi:nicotinamide riboside kinase
LVDESLYIDTYLGIHGPFELMNGMCLYDQMAIGDEDFIDMSTEEFFQRKEVIRRKDDLSLLVYTPIEFPVENDGERLVDELLRESFDQKIQQILKNSDIPHLRVTGTVEQRMMQIKEVVFSEK